MIKKQIKSEKELLEIKGYHSTLDGVEDQDKQFIHFKEFDTIIEVDEDILGEYRYLSPITNLRYKEEWLKDL